MEDNKNGRPRRPRIGQSERTYGVNRNSEHRNFGDRQPRAYGERSQRSYGDRPQRPYGERSPRPYGDRQQKTYGDRPQRDFAERPQRSYGERPYGERPYGERPQRPYGERSQKPYGERSQKPYGERSQKPYGEKGRKTYGAGNGNGFARKKNFSPKRKSADAATLGINRMISDRPQVDQELWSDNDLVCIPSKDIIRLNKFISNSGICSRREADNFIQAGVVTVNGEVVTELGTKVNAREDDIRFNGERLRGEEKVYIVMNKPKGYVTTASDPHADKVVMDLLKGCDARVFPIGRLDKNTTGVLMFTNDGEIAEKLTHPSYDKKKIYQVSLNKDLGREDFERIMEGVTLSDGDIAADDLQYIDDNDHRKLGIEIHSGKNRIVRRIFESLGYEVKALDRVYFAGVTKKGLKRGEWRYLTEGETNILKIGAYK
ncbi:MAG: pseudouridine synthase [Candidatus Cryptobacteroides sp.]|nr:pseudouridine synthase [Bacteroidales bacterium]MDY5744653.1 pseudouridine synthase [Candidatus Cryptobacteroides sp.]